MKIIDVLWTDAAYRREIMTLNDDMSLFEMRWARWGGAE